MENPLHVISRYLFTREKKREIAIKDAYIEINRKKQDKGHVQAWRPINRMEKASVCTVTTPVENMRKTGGEKIGTNKILHYLKLSKIVRCVNSQIYKVNGTKKTVIKRKIYLGK